LLAASRPIRYVEFVTSLRWVCFIVILAWAGTSSAQPLQVREAERMATEANGLQQGAHYEDAGRLFLMAYTVVDDTTFLLRAANAMQLAGELPMALNLYGQYLSREPGTTRRAEIERATRSMKQRVRKTYGQVIFESTPPGAIVTMAESGKILGKAPLTAWLRHGRVKISVEVPGHPAKVHLIEVARDSIATVKTVGRGGKTTPARPAAKGALRLLGPVKNASVTIDGQTVITANGTRAWRVRIGKRRVRVAPAKGAVFETTVEVREGSETVVDVRRE
jgi:hypothetical protein